MKVNISTRFPAARKVKASDRREQVKVAKAHRLVNHGPVFLVSSADSGAENFMPLAWGSLVSADPMLLCISVGHHRTSNKLITTSCEFVVNVPTVHLAETVLEAGQVSGRKFERFGLTPIAAEAVAAPLIGECAAHLECKVINQLTVGDHMLFVGQVLAASAVSGYLTEARVVDLARYPGLYHLGGIDFGVLNRTMQVG
ncbi:flavin reductase family protein [Candidatus Margulisiibacteriota bacterium]